MTWSMKQYFTQSRPWQRLISKPIGFLRLYDLLSLLSLHFMYISRILTWECQAAWSCEWCTLSERLLRKASQAIHTPLPAIHGIGFCAMYVYCKGMRMQICSMKYSTQGNISWVLLTIHKQNPSLCCIQVKGMHNWNRCLSPLLLRL